MPDRPAPTLAGERAAILQVFRDYTNTYAHHVEAAASFWDEPAIAILANRMIVLTRKADVVAFLSASLARLKSLDYSHSELCLSQVKMLNSTTALYGVVINRMKGDGTVLEQAGGTYVFRKGSAGWKIIEGIVTDPDKVINGD